MHQRDQQLEALQQEHLDLLKQFTSTQETLQSREQALGDLQVHRDELQARLDELQGEAAARDDAIRFLQNEKIVLEVAVQAAQSGREQFDRDAKCLDEGAQDTSETLEQLTQELAIKSSQVMQFAVTLLRVEITYTRSNADCLVLCFVCLVLFLKHGRTLPGEGPGLNWGRGPQQLMGYFRS